MSVRLMSLVFDYKFPKKVNYERLVFPFKRDPETKAVIYTSDKPEIRNVGTTGSSCKSVLLALADHANDDGKGAYPSNETLCRKTNLEKPTVISALLALRYWGFINFVGDSPRDTNNYDFFPEMLVKSFEDIGKPTLPVGVNPVYLVGKPTLPPEVNPLYPRGKPTLPEPSFNHPLNHPLTTPSAADENLAWLSKKYESTIGPITIKTSDELKELSTLPHEWLEYGFTELANARKTKVIGNPFLYFLAIVKTCEENKGIPAVKVVNKKVADKYQQPVLSGNELLLAQQQAQQLLLEA